MAFFSLSERVFYNTKIKYTKTADYSKYFILLYF